MSQFYEVVIFTSQPYYVRWSMSPWYFLNSNAFYQTVDPILDKLDPYNLYIMYRLYRESTRLVDGKIVKVRFHASSSA